MAEPDTLAMQRAVIDGDVETSRELARTLVESQAELLPAVENGFVVGIRRVGDLWDEGEYFLPELVQGAEAMKAAMEIIQPALRAAQQTQETKGRVVLGTVEGDVHDIGKSLVGVLLSANGFDVYDLGATVNIETFLAKAEEIDADIIAASAMLTTTMEGQARLVEAVKASDSHKHRHVMLGGAPTSRGWAEGLGAKHAENALRAVTVAEELMR